MKDYYFCVFCNLDRLEKNFFSSTTTNLKQRRQRLTSTVRERIVSLGHKFYGHDRILDWKTAVKAIARDSRWTWRDKLMFMLYRKRIITFLRRLEINDNDEKEESVVQ